MRQWWAGLQAREQRILIGGAAALLLMLGYLLVWEPYANSLEELRTRVAEQQETVAWMRQAKTEVQRLGGGVPVRGDSGGQSLLALVDATAKARGLGEAVKRVQPDGSRAVRVWLEQASFDGVLRWLDTLDREHGVRVTGLVAERSQAPGRTDARVVLEGG